MSAISQLLDQRDNLMEKLIRAEAENVKLREALLTLRERLPVEDDLLLQDMIDEVLR